MKSQVLRTHSVAAGSVAARLEALMGSWQRLLETAASSPDLADGARSREARGLLAGLLEAEPSAAAFAVVAADGGEVVRVQRKAAAAAVERVLADRHGLPLAALPTESGLWIRLEREIPGSRATLRLVADGQALAPALRSSENQVGEEAVLGLLTRDGQLLLASSPSARATSFPEKLREAAATGRVLGAGEYRQEGVATLGAFAPVAGTPWTVISRQPSDVANAVALRMRRSAALAVGGALGLTAVLVLVAYRTTVRPIRELAAAQSRLSGGTTRSRNEVEQLQEAFKALERNVEDQKALGEVFLGRYQVLELLGRGGMGSVFRGWDPRLQRAIALKTLRLGEGTKGTATREKVSGLLHEAVLTARCSHPNIVAVYDVEEMDEAAFISMEFVDGPSLDRHLKACRVLPAARAIPLAAAVAHALAAAHEQKVVHHDVKPGNVLLGRDGSIKVTDFGVARIVTALAARPDVIFGTVGYLPPEALSGGEYRESGDLFALGVLLYECLLGVRPFRGRVSKDVIAATLSGSFVPPDRLRPELTGAVTAAVSRLLEREPGRRPKSAAEVAEELDRLALSRGWKWTGLSPAAVDDAGARDDAPPSGLVATLGPPGGRRGPASRSGP